MEIDPVAQSLYFSSVSGRKKSVQSKDDKDDTEGAKVKRTKFNTLLDSATKKYALLQEGLSEEMCDMPKDSALVTLKDAVDITGDALQTEPSSQNIKNYRKAVSNFMHYIEKNSFEIKQIKRLGYNRRGRTLDPVTQIRIINQKLDKLAQDLLYNHADNLAILAAVGQINGLLVDLMAG